MTLGIAVQGDGRIVLAGAAFDKVGLARYLPDGALDPTFGTSARRPRSWASAWRRAWR
jgi:Domain of unknown function (DUF5122) beta-propeller